VCVQNAMADLFPRGYDHPEFAAGFLNYAKIVLTHFSDRVGTWITFNEPTLDAGNIKNWNSSYNVVMAHAETVHFYREQIRGTGQWSFKLALVAGFPIPLDPGSAADQDAARRTLDFSIGYMTLPVYHGAQVPASVTETLGSKAPNFSEAELAYVRGTCDFFAIDVYAAIYTSALVGGDAACKSNSSDPSYPICVNMTKSRAGWDMGSPSEDGTPVSRLFFSCFLTFNPTLERCPIRKEPNHELYGD
jgi:beta-glucosidase/6-phospho-beta-glucosidase/beta-galactosidase